MTVTVGVLVYPEAEVLDFAGPFEVFSTASRLFARQSPFMPPPFELATLAGAAGTVQTRGGFSVKAECALRNAPSLDVLIVPGGDEGRALDEPALMDWLQRQDLDRTLLASVCTGAFLLAAAGHLAGRRATTHHEDLDRFRQAYPSVQLVEQVRWVDEGRVVTSAGVSAGIDMCLHLVARLVDDELARATARNMAWPK